MKLVYQNHGKMAQIIMAVPDPLTSLVKIVKPPRKPKQKNRKRSRPTTHYQRFREDVLERCGHQCVACGAKDTKRLVVHHLNSYSVFEDLMLDPDNGVSLCRECDQGFHGTYGTVGNTRSQFMEWMNSK